MKPASPSACVSASLSLSLCVCVCLSWLNKFLKILKNKIKFLLLLYISNYENYWCSFPIPTLLILIFGWLQFPIHCHPVYWLPVFLGFQYVYRWSFQHLHFWHLESSPLMFLFFTLQKQLTTDLVLRDFCISFISISGISFSDPCQLAFEVTSFKI